MPLDLLNKGIPKRDTFQVNETTPLNSSLINVQRSSTAPQTQLKSNNCIAGVATSQRLTDHDIKPSYSVTTEHRQKTYFSLESSKSEYRARVQYPGGYAKTFQIIHDDNESLGSALSKLESGEYKANVISFNTSAVLWLGADVILKGGVPARAPESKAELLRSLNRDLTTPSQSQRLINLGKFMLSNETVTINGDTFSKQKVFAKAIRLKPDSAVAYYLLGKTIQPRTMATVLGGYMSKRDCFVRAIELNPRAATSYYELGVLNKNGEYAHINGHSLDAKSCFVAALGINSQLTEAWMGLGQALSDDQQIRVGETGYKNKDCFKKVLEIDHRNAEAYLNLSRCLRRTDSITVNRESLNRVKCLKKVIRYDAHNHSAYFLLSVAMNREESFEVAGRQMSKIDCMLKAVDLNPEETSISIPTFLEMMLSRAHRWKVNGRMMSSEECIAYIAGLGPRYSAVNEKLSAINPAHVVANQEIATQSTAMTLSTQDLDRLTINTYQAQSSDHDSEDSTGAQVGVQNLRRRNTEARFSNNVGESNSATPSSTIPSASLAEQQARTNRRRQASRSFSVQSTHSVMSINTYNKAMTNLRVLGRIEDFQELIETIRQVQIVETENMPSRVSMTQRDVEAIAENHATVLGSLLGQIPAGVPPEYHAYFRSFMAAFQHVFALSNVLATSQFQLNTNILFTAGRAIPIVKEETAQNLMQGVFTTVTTAMDQAASYVPLVGGALKTLAAAAAFLEEEHKYRKLNPFAILFGNVLQAQIVASKIAEHIVKNRQLQRVITRKIAEATGPGLFRRARLALRVDHRNFGDYSKVDELALKHVRKIIDGIYDISRNLDHFSELRESLQGTSISRDQSMRFIEMIFGRFDRTENLIGESNSATAEHESRSLAAYIGEAITEASVQTIELAEDENIDLLTYQNLQDQINAMRNDLDALTMQRGAADEERQANRYAVSAGENQQQLFMSVFSQSLEDESNGLTNALNSIMTRLTQLESRFTSLEERNAIQEERIIHVEEQQDAVPTPPVEPRGSRRGIRRR